MAKPQKELCAPIAKSLADVDINRTIAVFNNWTEVIARPPQPKILPIATSVKNID